MTFNSVLWHGPVAFYHSTPKPWPSPALWSETLGPLGRYQTWMGSRMANSSIVPLTFPHIWLRNTLPYQVLTPILVHIKPTKPHLRSHIKDSHSLPSAQPSPLGAISRHGSVIQKKVLSVWVGVRSKKQTSVHCPFGLTMEGPVLVQRHGGGCWLSVQVVTLAHKEADCLHPVIFISALSDTDRPC